MKASEIVENVHNGNLSIAKKAARRVPHWELREAFFDMGYSACKATLGADWLKGRQGVWQSFCDAK